MHKLLLAVLLIYTSGQSLRADDPAESYVDAHARALRLDGTAESKAYGPVFSKAVAPVIIDAIRECVAHARIPGAVDLVLILDADGSVRRVIPEPSQPVAACVAERLAGAKLPPPPRSGWPASVSIAIK